MIDEQQAERGARQAVRIERVKVREQCARATIQGLEIGDFRFFVTQAKRQDADPIETPLASELWATLDRMEMLSEEREREKRFVFKVCEALSRFHEHEPIQILWDVDDVLGCNNEDGELQFRPVILPLLELIHAKYPLARHGFITDRGNWESPQNKQMIDAISARWPLDADLLFSTERNVPEDLQLVCDEYEMAVSDIFESLEVTAGEKVAGETFIEMRRRLATDSRARGKAIALSRAGLLDDAMTLVVDDGELPLYLGDRGVYVDFHARAYHE